MTTWYVRPDASHGGTNAGTSYANAWQGWASITWGGGGVVGGDTLYVCGAHTSGAGNLTVGAHGASSNAARVTISGGYVTDPGSITFSGGYYLSSSRSYTTFDSLTITAGTSACLWWSDTQSNVSCIDCTLVGGGGASALSMPAHGSRTYTDVLIDGCTFTGDVRNGANSSGAINWLVGSAAISNLARWTIQNCTFTELITGRSAIHLRIQGDADVSSTMADMSALNNTFLNVAGNCIELTSGFDALNSSAGVVVDGNSFDGCTVSPVNSSGSCVSVWGFGPSSSDGFGEARISNNRAANCVSAGGFLDLFFGSYVVRDNYAENMSTDTIDSNGVLLDYGCDNCKIYRNTFRNLFGKAGVVNSGCGIMVLDSTNIWCFGNTVVGCLTGVYFGAASSVHSTGQSAVIEGNTFIDCSDYGVYLLASSEKANTIVRNNIFTAADASAPSVTNVGAAWTADESTNCFYGFAAASNHTLDGSDITADPELSADNRPQDGSPMIAAGAHTGYRRDGMGRLAWNPPTIGAYEYQRARIARSLPA